MLAPELFAVAIVLGAALVVMWRVARASGARAAVVAPWLGGVAAVAVLAGFARPAPPSPPPAGTPKPTDEGGYVSSAACRACHPSEHASWARSYHRTMTQVAGTETVRAPLPSTLTDWTVAAEGDRVVASSGAERLPLVLATGSHHYQAYWMAGERPGELRLFPWVWVFADAAWQRRSDVFLQPPGAPEAEHGARWNSNCIACHAVGGRPEHDDEANVFRTRTAELGIACEACHGPGASHVAAHRSPLARLSQSGTGDPTIVNPRRLDAARSAAVCGQCHAYAYPRDEATFWTSGYSERFRPGDSLDASRFVLFPETLGAPGGPSIEASTESVYWRDGTIRVGGREYNGLARSPCFEHGDGERKLSCLSCHSMHASDPDDQLRRDRTTTQACLGCHAGRDAPAHVNHAAGSAATRCESCHMPKTTYALLKGIRSHRIESPSVATAVATGRPTACNLCHLDRSLAWTAAALAATWKVPLATIPTEVANVPVAGSLALRGDAAMRALVADALGDADARAASGSDWQRDLLDELAHDDYAAVRTIARRSRAKFDGGDTRFLLPPGLRPVLLAQRDTRAITISE